MITGSLKGQVDALWLEFWQGGIANPLTVIEQITFLMFARLLDIAETRDENRFKRTGKAFARRFNDREQELRWSRLVHMDTEQMLPFVRDKVFAHLKKSASGESSFAEFMKDAQLMIQKPSLLVKAVALIDQLPLTEGDAKGDLYEYLLSKLTTAGINGQFRTPRHIIRLMVDMLDPKPTDRIADPSCGTGGFLVTTMQYLQEKYSSPAGILTEEDADTGKIEKIYTGDLLEPHREHIRQDMFHGFDFDATMLRIAAMNLMLHGVDDPDIHYQDTLSNSFPEHFPEAASDAFDVILANPPFKGQLDFDDVHPALLRLVKTRRTELLFIVLILRMLKQGGRSATIVPDGVLFGSSSAHVALRKLLIDNNQLEAVISLPSGVFKPYAGVSTGILVFTKGGRTDDVFFYDVQADGFSLDDKRDVIKDNDLSDCLERWRNRNQNKENDRKEKAFFVPASEIREGGYDLSLNRYKENVLREEVFDAPAVIVERMTKLSCEISADLRELQRLLK
jgi:type I restriction enzyme M protein